MTNTPLASVAVIIPYYNGAAFIERALNSVIRQTIKPQDIIVVNDGSKPEEKEFLISIQSKYEFTILHKENGGQGSARNAGVEKTNAQYLCFLDQDDYFLDRHIEILLKSVPLNESKFGFSYADLIEANGDGDIVSIGIIKQFSTHPKKSVIEMIQADMFILPSASIINREAFIAVGGFDPQFTGYEDDDLFLRMFRKGFAHIFVDQPVTVWCIHSGSTSYSVKMLTSRFRYFSKLIKSYPDEPHRHRYHIKHCILPRFGIRFIEDSLNIQKINPAANEIFNIVRKYAEIVADIESVSADYKLKLSLYSKYCLGLPKPLRRRAGRYLLKAKY